MASCRGVAAGRRFESSMLTICLPGAAAELRDEDVAACIAEICGREGPTFAKAVSAVAELTALEIELLDALACLSDARTPAQRSWRGRMLGACAALSKLDSSMLLPAVMLARRSRRFADAQPAQPGRGRPLSPFTAASATPGAEGGE